MDIFRCIALNEHELIQHIISTTEQLLEPVGLFCVVFSSFFGHRIYRFFIHSLSLPFSFTACIRWNRIIYIHLCLVGGAFEWIWFDAGFEARFEARFDVICGEYSKICGEMGSSHGQFGKRQNYKQKRGGGALNPLKSVLARFDARFDVICGKYSNNCGKMVNLAKGKIIKKMINFQSTQNCKTPRNAVILT